MYYRGTLHSVWILLGVRESQNGWGWQGFWEVTWSNPVPQAGSPRGLLHKTTFWQLLNISKEGDLMKSMGSLCPTLSAPQWKNVSWHLQRVSCVPVCVQCLLSHHWGTLNRAWLPVPYIPQVSDICICWDSRSFCSLESQISQPFLTWRMLQSLNFLCDPSLVLTKFSVGNV